jgi:hypothetical protein
MFKIDLKNKVLYILEKTSFSELNELIDKLNIDESWSINYDENIIYYPSYPWEIIAAGEPLGPTWSTDRTVC